MTHLLAYTPMVGLFVLLWAMAIVSGAAAVVASSVWATHRRRIQVRSRRERPG